MGQVKRRNVIFIPAVSSIPWAMGTRNWCGLVTLISLSDFPVVCQLVGSGWGLCISVPSSVCASVSVPMKWDNNVALFTSALL